MTELSEATWTVIYLSSIALTTTMTNKTDPYVAASSLEWKLGIHLSEWKAARNLAERLNKDPAADAAYLQGVKDLLNDFLATYQKSK